MGKCMYKIRKDTWKHFKLNLKCSRVSFLVLYNFFYLIKTLKRRQKVGDRRGGAHKKDVKTNLVKFIL